MTRPLPAPFSEYSHPQLVPSSYASSRPPRTKNRTPNRLLQRTISQVEDSPPRIRMACSSSPTGAKSFPVPPHPPTSFPPSATRSISPRSHAGLGPQLPPLTTLCIQQTTSTHQQDDFLRIITWSAKEPPERRAAGGQGRVERSLRVERWPVVPATCGSFGSLCARVDAEGE